MKSVVTIILSVLCLPFTGRTQINLVVNPNFEQYSVCPDNADETKYCNHWMSLDSSWSPPDWAHAPFGVPEYCNSCSSSLGWGSIPYNYNFIHDTRSGNGMMSVQMFSSLSTTPNKRDYLQGHLNNTLIAGHKYNVRFYAASEQYSGYAINNIGAYLDNGAIDTTHNPGYVQKNVTPQIVDTSIIDDTLNWVKIEGTFTANGTERLITIGQFSDSAHTNFHAITTAVSTGSTYSWYLIDDVSVIDCNNVPFAGHDTLIHLGDSVFLGSHETLLPYTWYKYGAATPIDSGGGIWVRPAVTTIYTLEQNLCGTTITKNVKIRVYPDTITEVTSVGINDRNLQIYPNPATKELTIEGAKNCEVVFYDVTGKEILHSKIVTDKQALDISSLPKGFYLVKVEDPVTGESVTKRLLKE